MSDLNHHNDEEYHFDDSENFDFGEHDATEEEFIGEEDVAQEPKDKEWNNSRAAETESTKKALPTKKILIGVGVAVLLIVGYYLMAPRGKTAVTTEIPSATAPKKASKENKPTTPISATNSNTAAVTQHNAAPTEQNAASVANANTVLENDGSGAWLGNDNGNGSFAAPSAEPATGGTSTNGSSATVPTTADNSLSMQVQTLNQENQVLTLKLQAVTAQSEATAARATSLEKTLAQLQAQIKQMKQESSAPVSLQRSHSVAATPVTNTSNSAPTKKSVSVYYVEAIIPGRAWIGDSNGRIITVTQGDRIDALNSTVKNIDPINGIVTLSNGMQIEYGMVAQ